MMQIQVNNCWYLLNELQMKCIKLNGQLFVFALKLQQRQQRRRQQHKDEGEKKETKPKLPNGIYGGKTSTLLIIGSFFWLLPKNVHFERKA